MKKILLGTALCLSVLLTTGCGESTQEIQIKDSKGELQTVTISETDDKEVVQNVINYTNQANYDDVTSIKLTSHTDGILSVDAGAELGEFSPKGSISLNADVTFQASSKGLDLTAAAAMTIDKGLTGGLKDKTYSADARVTCDLLSGSSILDSEIYASYDVKTQDINNNAKFRISLTNLVKYIELGMEENKDIFDQYFPSNPSDDEDITLDEFYATFSTSKISISEVNSDSICILFSLSYKDLVKMAEGDLAELGSLLDMSKTIDYRVYVDTASGRLKGVSYEWTDKDFVKLFFTSVSAPDDFITDFKISMNMNLEYNGEVSWKSIPASEKEDYVEIPAPKEEENPKDEEVQQPEAGSTL